MKITRTINLRSPPRESTDDAKGVATQLTASLQKCLASEEEEKQNREREERRRREAEEERKRIQEEDDSLLSKLRETNLKLAASH